MKKEEKRNEKTKKEKKKTSTWRVHRGHFCEVWYSSMEKKMEGRAALTISEIPLVGVGALPI